MHPAISVAFAETIPNSQHRAQLLDAVISAYSLPSRAYHNLRHLAHLAGELEAVRGEVADWNLLMLAAAYHDVIYDPARPDNEEASAARACIELQPFLEPQRMQALQDIILATKRHEQSADPDTNLFCDADLAILGAAPEAYDTYAAQIRQEYAQYPDALYNPGRAAVLGHLIPQPELFKSAFYRQRYEAPARANLERELLLLRAHTES